MSKTHVLLTQAQIQERVKELGRQITADFAGKRVHCLGVLKGAFVFMADLVRHIDLEVTTDFLTISSYGDLTQSSGVVKFLTDLTVPIADRDLLVVEDIVDTGLTLRYLLDNLKTRNPNSVRVCTFLHKPESTKIEVPIDYCGFVIPNRFMVGYGLDSMQKYRNLPYLMALEEEQPESPR